MSLLGLLAAVVPICGSLIVGAHFLSEQARLRDEERRRRGLVSIVAGWETNVVPSLVRSARARGVAADISSEVRAFEARMLDHHGLRPSEATWTDFDLQYSMSGPLVPRSEIIRQRILLVSAVAGVILLAFDLAI